MRCWLVVAAGLAALGCSGESERLESDRSAPPSYRKSPIVFALRDTTGLSFVTLEDQALKPINDAPYSGQLAMSPSRTRLLRLPTSGVLAEFYEIGATASPLLQTTLPGRFIGWLSDDEILAFGPLGLSRVTVDGENVDVSLQDSLPPGATFSSGAVSPDRKSVAVVSLGSDVALWTFDARSGGLLGRWAIPEPASGPFWADDGTILLLSSGYLHSVALGERSMRLPVALPFAACGIDFWVDPDVVQMSETVLTGGDILTCMSGWLVDTQGSVLGRGGGGLVSADRQRLLLSSGDGLVVAAADGSEREVITGLPELFGAIW